MNINYTIIVGEWIITIALLFKFIPRNKFKKATLAFLFNQVITWLFGLLVVELRLIKYPVRLLFTYASKTSFTFEYFVYPSICGIFNVYYPTKKNFVGQFMYYFYYCTSMTILEVIFEKYTDILKYIHWTWYITWITLFFTFYVTRKFYVWFFKSNINDNE